MALAPAAASAQTPGPDYVASDNIEHVRHLKQAGDLVNLEVDVIAKYVEKMVKL